jgi:hypothetical protein
MTAGGLKKKRSQAELNLPHKFGIINARIASRKSREEGNLTFWSRFALWPLS